MRWSKLKQKIESFICPELNGRVEFGYTFYRVNKTHPPQDRIWVTYDGQEIINCSYNKYWNYIYNVAREYKNQGYSWNEAIYLGKQTAKINEIHDTIEIGNALSEYPNISISNALSSDNQFIYALAIIDRRLGNNRLHRLSISDADHSLVKILYNYRIMSL